MERLTAVAAAVADHTMAEGDGAYHGGMLAAVRATHEHLDLGVLDVLTRDAGRLPQVIADLNANGGPLDGWVVLATCNRLEIYVDTERFHDGLDLLTDAVTEISGLDAEHVSLCLQAAMGAPVAEHLYMVTAGLDSIVIGEAEVTGQVRSAFDCARRSGYTTSMLNDLFQVGFRYAKKVTSRTPVGAAGRSGVAIALDHAVAHLGALSQLDVLVIGTGAYARLGVAELTRRGAGRVRVHSASGRAVAFAERHGVEAIPGEDLGQVLREADLVLACSGRGTSLFPDHFRDVGRTLILDLALHSDLHPLVRHLTDVDILDLTDLSIEVDEKAAPVLEAAKGIIADGVEQFRSRQQFRRVDPAMASLRRTLSDATDAEVSRLRREDKGQAADDVERSVRRILAKAMHSPTLRAREFAQQGNADEFVQAFHTIFGIDITDSVAGDGGTQHLPGIEPEQLTSGWMRLDQTVPPSSARDTLDADISSERTLRALADLARIGVADGGGQNSGSCPLTPAQQQEFLAKVSRDQVSRERA